MAEKIQGLVIRNIRHSDNISVISVYSPVRGRIACVLRTSSGRTGKVPVLPLSLIEGNISSSQSSSLPRISAVSVYGSFPGISCNPAKSAVAIFILDFLDKLLVDTPPDEGLYNYLTGSIALFDRMKSGWADFHIVLLSSLTHFLGVQPDISGWNISGIFDMRAGEYSSSFPGHRDILTGDEARIPYLLSRINYRNSYLLHLSGQQRMRIIEGLLKYYSIHLPGVSEVRSHKILSSVFSR